MSDNPLKSLAEYSHFITETLDRPGVQRSTVVVWSDSPYTGTAEGEVFFAGGVRLRMREELDFNAGLITSYGYEVYQGEVRMYWYDDFPHPNSSSLAKQKRARISPASSRAVFALQKKSTIIC
jgi:hypothetical protein